MKYDINDENISGCECTHDHEDIVQKIKGDMPGEEMLLDLAELFKVFGDQTRIKIIFILFKESIYTGTIYCIFYIISHNKHQLYITKRGYL